MLEDNILYKKSLTFIKSKKLYSVKNIKLSGTDYISVYYLLDDSHYFHHLFLPSLIILNAKKDFRRDCYFSHGILHRENGPAETTASFSYLDKKLILLESFNEKAVLYKNKECLGINNLKLDSSLLDFFVSPAFNSPGSRKHGPSQIFTSPGSMTHKYEKDGVMHREDGPAFIEWNQKKELIKKYWYIEGKEILIEDKL